MATKGFMAVASAILIAALLQSGHIAQPDRDAVSPALADPATCSELLPYRDDLYGALEAHQLFLDQFQGDWRSTAGSLDADAIGQIVEDGRALLDELHALDGPDAYHPGHDGVLGFFQYRLDSIVFYGVDSSTSPDSALYADALRNIYDGEVRAVESCPTEVEEAGGYVLFSPETLEEVLFP